MVCPRTVHAMYRPPHFGVPRSLVAAWSVTCGVHPEYLRPRPLSSYAHGAHGEADNSAHCNPTLCVERSWASCCSGCGWPWVTPRCLCHGEQRFSTAIVFCCEGIHVEFSSVAANTSILCIWISNRPVCGDSATKKIPRTNAKYCRLYQKDRQSIGLCPAMQQYSRASPSIQ